MTFTCRRCSHAEPYPLWVTNRYREDNTVHRCSRCGSPHSCRYGREPEAIHPELLSIGQGAKPSPWFDPRHRPYRAGYYECYFADGVHATLRWDGAAWRWCGQVVDTSNLMKWRGSWN